MELKPGNVQKPVRKLRKSLKSLASDPTTRNVHDLRTRLRRVEAIAGLLNAGGGKSRNPLLKALKPLRKAAGEVRDMDVLTAKARTLAKKAHQQRKDAHDSLKEFSRQLEKLFATKAGGCRLQTDTAMGLMDELSHWPQFSTENLHAFRIKVK